MKASEGFSSLGLTVLAATGYIFSLIFFGRSMRILPMGFAYALWVGLGMAIVMILGVVIYKESFNWKMAIGLGLVIAGLISMNIA